MRKVIKMVLPIADLILIPFIIISCAFMKVIRRTGVHRLPCCKKVLLLFGVFPIRNHYYEPLFDENEIKYPLSNDRDLPGISWNIDEQLQILDNFLFHAELLNNSTRNNNNLDFYFNNGAFESGDAEYWYNFIRFKKPKRIYEIGGGFSTRLGIKAIAKNKEENPEYYCEYICIEPFEMPWLEQTGVTVCRNKVENVGKEFFSELGDGDILFIDSSHIIRPQGDVLFEYLELLPSLKRGVIVHIHDIFSPKDYLEEWIMKEVKFWNEQYLLEAFLTSNRQWKIIGALNYLHHNHYDKLKEKSPYLTKDREPGSFYIQKIE
jgi:hypothetical protein